MFLPHKKSKFWILIIAIFFLLNFGGFLISRYLLGTFDKLTFENIIGFVILSTINTSFIGLGYFGLNVFAGTVMGLTTIAVIYLMSVSILNIYDGCTDLTSLAGYETLIIAGIILGTIGQLTKFILRKNKQK
jgi:hypothetical protein